MNLEPSEKKESLKNILSKIDDEKKVLSKISKNIKKFSARENKVQTIEDLLYINKIINSIDSDISSLSSDKIRDLITNWSNNEKKDIESNINKLQSNFAMNLYNNLKDIGIKLEGHMPKLKAGFYKLEINLLKNECNILFGQDKEKITTIKVDPQAISKYIENHQEKLENNYESSDTFVHKLEKAYSNAVKKSDNLNTQVPIIELMLELSMLKQSNQLKSNPSRLSYKNYGRIQFSYDLFRLIQDRPEGYNIKLSTATRDQARNRGKYLWIPKNNRGEGSIFSHLEFSRL